LVFQDLHWLTIPEPFIPLDDHIHPITEEIGINPCHLPVVTRGE